MAIDPLPNNGSQVERAARAWLASATSENDPAAQGILHAASIYATNDSRTRDAQRGLIDIQAKSSQHDPDSQGTEVWQVAINSTFPAAKQPGQSNPDLNRLLIDRQIGLIDAAMSQTSKEGVGFDATATGITAAGRALKTTGSTQDKANNWDMADFTCLFVRYLGATRGHPVDGDGNMDRTFWVESRNYEITACPANVD